MSPSKAHLPIKRNLVLILGLQGQGKTSLCKLIHQKVTRSVVIDDHNEFSDGVRIETLPDLVDYLSRNHSRPFRVLYSSRTLSTDPLLPGSEFNRLCAFLFNIPDHAFFINELGLYTTSSQIPEELKKLITQGRREFIDIICTVRRKTETQNIFTSQANVVASFKQILPEDVKYMRGLVGEELADKIHELEPLEFVWSNQETFGIERVSYTPEGKVAGAINFLKSVDWNGSPVI